MPETHLTSAELAAYYARTLAAGETLAASDHLAGCDECRAKLVQLVNAAPAADPRTVPGEISFEHLAGWLDNDLDPLTRREVATSLSHTPQARAELIDLADFRDAMNALPARDHSATPVASQTARHASPRWLLPLAAAVTLSGAAIWWANSGRSSASISVALKDGERVIAFGADGRSRALANLSQPLSDSVAETIRTGRVDLNPEVAALAGQTGVLAGAPHGAVPLRVLAPVGTAVRDARPRFRWTAVDGASAYQLNIVEETSGALVVSQQLPPDATEWQPPDPLPAGEVYQWEIQALRDGAVFAKSPAPPEPEARFEILSLARVAELDEAQRASGGSHLVMGVANARAGLIDEAAREFRLLSEQNPEMDLPRRLLQQVEAHRARKP